MRDGIVLEGTHCNLCAIFKGELITAPATNYILSDVTGRVVLELCKKIDVPVREFPVFEHQLDKSKELMIVGTIVEITPVVKINDKEVGEGKPGPLTKKLQGAFYDFIVSRKNVEFK